MSRVKLPYTPKAKLSDMLRRRGQTLASFVTELGIKNALQLEIYCNERKLEPPRLDDIVDVFAMQATPPRRDPLIVEVPSAIDLVIDQVREEKAEAEEKKAKGKKVKNALVRLGDETSAEEPEKKAV